MITSSFGGTCDAPVSSNRVVLGLAKGSSDELLGRIKPLVPLRGTTASHTDKFN